MAKLGTPENPEIILPGEKPKAARPTTSRWRVCLQIASIMIALATPAFIIDTICFWLLDTQEPLAWLLLIVLAVPAALLSFIAVAANSILFILLLGAIFGRTPKLEFQNLGRFVRR